MVNFALLLKPLYYTRGNLAVGEKPVDQELLVFADRLGDILHRLQLRPHGACAPFLEETSSPAGR